ncbi:MAG: transcription antitermination factor NusB [Phycisphaeraceae bacterium]|nr:transcription antitermination factor NusB [Phycisphaeraceae bacterium]
MISAQRVRVAAFQMLYGLDAHGASDERALELLRGSVLEENQDLEPRELRLAEKLALAAYEGRGPADALFESLSPAWPVSRQPAVDRSILRLAYYEMSSGKAPPKVAIDEAVELARRFSTEKSPAFVNALLDAAMRTLAGSAAKDLEPGAC